MLALLIAVLDSLTPWILLLERLPRLLAADTCGHRCVYGLWSPPHVLWLLFVLCFSPALGQFACSYRPHQSRNSCTHTQSCQPLNSSLSFSIIPGLATPPNPFPSFLCQLQGDPALLTAGEAELSLQLPPKQHHKGAGGQILREE